MTGRRDDPPPATELPWIISVDDHVLETPEIWTTRLPAKYHGVGPRVVRERGVYAGRMDMAWTPDAGGAWADVWYYEDLVKPLGKLFGAAGFDTKTLDWEVAIFDDLRPGCTNQRDRLADMDLNRTEVSICFPNTLPRFCGQTFAEAKDKDLALLCVQAYNDWMIDDWCGGEGRGRLIPLTIVPLWDPQLAAEEIHRCAAKGSHAVTFSENPYALGLPSVHTGQWDPFFRACSETDTTVCMHIGSSSRLPATAPDAPHPISSVLLAHNAAGSLLDLVMGGIMHRFPDIKVAYSEANAGWMPYIIERMDKIWLERGHETTYGSSLPNLPSSYIQNRVFACIIDDETGILLRDRVGDFQICFETDYPHADSKWPDSPKIAAQIIKTGALNDAEIYKFLRGNAIEAFGLERFGVTT